MFNRSRVEYQRGIAQYIGNRVCVGDLRFVNALAEVVAEFAKKVQAAFQGTRVKLAEFDTLQLVEGERPFETSQRQSPKLTLCPRPH